ncbi:MAG TPA: hypothetical protein VK866_19505 [Acidimicrobiales bacterium]|nr:hypothetical protein [Acidimicrobiales bacterium]
MDDRTASGVAHLQAAARELIAAARTFLDVAEDLVDDPQAVSTVLDGLGGLGDVVRGRTGASTSSESPTTSDAQRVERIVVE